MLAKTFRFRVRFPFPLPPDDLTKKNAFEILKLKLRVLGPAALFRGMPVGRSLTTPSRLSSVPVETLYQLGPTSAIVPVKNTCIGSRAFTELFTLCVG